MINYSENLKRSAHFYSSLSAFKLSISVESLSKCACTSSKIAFAFSKAFNYIDTENQKDWEILTYFKYVIFRIVFCTYTKTVYPFAAI